MFTVQLTTFGLLLLTAAIETSPLARIRLKFAQPPHHIQEHGITTNDGRLVSQQSYLQIGNRNVPSHLEFGARLKKSESQMIGSQFQTISQKRYSSFPDRQMSDYSNGLYYLDPLLLTGKAAILAVKYIYGRGEIFYHEIPHARALLRNQEVRQQNGLRANILSSLRPNSPWFRRDD